MKKLKVMLLSLALLAIVGGALAFKAKSTVQYCTSAAVAGTCGAPNTFTCPNLVFSTTIGVQNEPFVCTALPTTYTFGVDQTDFGCVTNLGIWQQGDFRTSTISCITTVQLKAD